MLFEFSLGWLSYTFILLSLERKKNQLLKLNCHLFLILHIFKNFVNWATDNLFTINIGRNNVICILKGFSPKIKEFSEEMN